MDAMTAAADEYARNIRKFGKPALTFNQLMQKWWELTHPVVPDDVIAARCIEMVRNPPAVEIVEPSDKLLFGLQRKEETK